MTGLGLGQSSVHSAHGSLQPHQLVYGVLLVRFIFGLGRGGDQAALVQLLIRASELTKLYQNYI